MFFSNWNKKFIVEPSFFTSWTITGEKCTRAHVEENTSIYIYISLSMKTFLKTGVYIYIDIDIYRYMLLFSCTCASVHFSLVIVHLLKSRFNDKFFLCRVLCSNLKRTCRLSFFRKMHAPYNTNLQWRIKRLILGMKKTARETAEL